MQGFIPVARASVTGGQKPWMHPSPGPGGGPQGG